jgi:putative ABC transport system permease protein
MLHDLRYGARMLAIRPLFTVFTVALLAIGIAASVVVFCLADAILWRSTPIRDPERLVQIVLAQPGMQSVTTLALDSWAARHSIMGATFLYQMRPVIIGAADRAEAASIALVTPGLMTELGIRLRGRDLSPDDDGQKVVIISDDTWRSQFDAAVDAIGRPLLIEGEPHTVIAIAPKHFGFPLQRIRAWVPLGDPPPRILRAVARLRPGVTFDQAARFTASSSVGLSSPRSGPALRLAPFVEIDPRTVRAVRVAMIAGLCLLFIGTANAGNLLLAEAVRRADELAVRRSLGATWLALARQMLIETGLRCVAASATALVVASWLVDAIAVRVPIIMTYQSLRPIAIDWRAVAFAVGVSITAACGAALIPCVSVARANVRGALHAGGVATTSRTRLRDVLTVAQLAATLVLLASAALLANGFARLIDVKPGFESDGLTAAALSLPQRQVGDRSALELKLAQLRAEARALPGVMAATTADGVPPYVGYGGAAGFQTAYGTPMAGSLEPVPFAYIDDAYFDTLELPLLEGRAPAAASSAPPFPAVITRSLAERLWPGRSPIGERFRYSDEDSWMIVAGVVPDLRFGSIDSPRGRLCVFIRRSTAIAYEKSQLLVVRARKDAALDGPLRALVQRVLPGAAVRSVKGVPEMMVDENARVRFATELMSTLALVGSGLAALGVYGAFWCTVRQRRREIGIRLAIGAAPRCIVRMVLADSTRLVLIALAAGAPLAFAASTALKPFLFEVSPVDLPTFVLVSIGLTAAALAAAYGPARHASRIDPVETLRAE